jgi:hypothetical protein
MGEGSWSISMNQAPVDMKLTMDLKDPCTYYVGEGIMVNFNGPSTS